MIFLMTALTNSSLNMTFPTWVWVAAVALNLITMIGESKK